MRPRTPAPIVEGTLMSIHLWRKSDTMGKRGKKPLSVEAMAVRGNYKIILDHLRRNPRACQKDLKDLGISHPQNYLYKLMEHGVIKCEAIGKKKYYSLNNETCEDVDPELIKDLFYKPRLEALMWFIKNKGTANDCAEALGHYKGSIYRDFKKWKEAGLLIQVDRKLTGTGIHTKINRLYQSPVESITLTIDVKTGEIRTKLVKKEIEIGWC